MGKLALSTAIECSATPTGPTVKAADAIPTRRYIKQIIKLGTFVHPTKKWVLNVTPERMDGWIANNAKMIAAGVSVPLTKDHKQGADGVAGESFEMFRDGEWLNAVVEARGEKNIDLVEGNKHVSLEIEPQVKDSMGNTYGESITRVSIVQKPIIPGQAGFQRIAASMDDDECPTYFLSTGEPEMKTLLAALVGLAASAGLTLSADAGEDAAVKTVNDVKAKFSGLEADKTDLTKKLSLAGEGHQPDAKYLSLACKSAEKDIDSLKGFLSDAGVIALKKELLGDPAKKEFSKLLLSVEDEADGVAMVENIVKIIRDHPGVKRGTQSGSQGTIHLSAEPDPKAGDTDPTKVSADRVNELLAGTVTGREMLATSARK